MKHKKELEKWLASSVVDEETKGELAKLDASEAEDRFYKSLDFGTGGLRGVMGAGTNRMNVYTVRHASQGLANEILALEDGGAERGVVIAYDSRHNSRLFATECARVLCANSIKAYLFDGVRPTPELSFAVRHLGCIRGVVITASHNPKEYNGYKVYGEDGGQLDPESAARIMAHIQKTDIFADVRVADTTDFISVGEEIDKAYLSCVKAQSTGVNIPPDFKVVYTPLHGSGGMLVEIILRSIGVKNLLVVPEQAQPDGDFPTVVSPNPEDSRALEISIDYAKRQNADLVLATDPDSDRLGVAIRSEDGDYIALNGNQTGVVLCEFIASRLSKDGGITKDSTVVKTIVTTEMIRAITDCYGIGLLDVLTGFKFIGREIKLLEDKGLEQEFVFGLEESYGYLKGTYARDKDAVVAAMLMTEVSASCKAKGITVPEYLNSLYVKYGYYMESLETRTLDGIEGAEKIKDIMTAFRSRIPLKDVVSFKDYSKGIDNLPKADVLKFFLSDDSYFAVRPSGTEPKIKFYFGVRADGGEEALAMLEKLRKRVLNAAFEEYTDDMEMGKDGPCSVLCREVADYVDSHALSIGRLKELSDLFAYNYCYLSQRFKNQMGITLSEYYRRARLRVAKDLLEEGDLSVSRIAEKVGYTSLFSFSKAFRYRYGVSPSKYVKAIHM